MQPFKHCKQLHLQQLLGSRGSHKAVGLLDQWLVDFDQGSGGRSSGAVYFHAGLVSVQLQHIGGEVQHFEGRALACELKTKWDEMLKQNTQKKDKPLKRYVNLKNSFAVQQIE